MPGIFADGTAVPPLLVFKGKSGMRMREVKRADGTRERQLIVEKVGEGSFADYNSSIAGVNGDIFYQWALRMVDIYKPRQANVKPILLTYDGYRSLLTHTVVALFEGRNISAATRGHLISLSSHLSRRRSTSSSRE